MKPAFVKSALTTIALSRAGSLMPTAAGRGVIFTLHHVRPKQSRPFDPNAHLEITPKFLETAILAAKAAGLKPVALAQLPDLLKNGDPKSRYCAFTLDDGYRNNAEFAAPVFRKHAIPYTIFICPGFVKRTRILWWETTADLLERLSAVTINLGNGRETIDTKELQAKHAAFARIAAMVETLDENEAVNRIASLAISHGFDPLEYVRRELMDEADIASLAADPLCAFGGHTLTHCNLARVEDERVHREISHARTLVSKYAGRPVDTFAYPYGWDRAAGPREFHVTARLGFTAAVTTRAGVLTEESIFTGLPRVSLNGLYQKRRYVKALITGIPFKLMR